MQIRGPLSSMSQSQNCSKMMTLWLACLILTATVASGFQSGGGCEGAPRCECKWSEGKRMADCSGRGFTQIPSSLSESIQTLVLDGNPLRKLEGDGFKSAGLLNLQTLSLKGCYLHYVDENAFRDLTILTHVDLSNNNLTQVFPKTFDGNNGLKTLKLAHNFIDQLRSYQFPPLRALKTIDLSYNALTMIDQTSFHNLDDSVETVMVNDNRLTFLQPKVFLPLTNLKSLKIHNNPWTCDCELKSFRDWAVDKKLYSRPTACNEPSRLNGKMWDEIQPAEFACKPHLEIPYPRVFGAPGVDATLACKIKGSPVPQGRWVVDGRIVNNNTHPEPFASQMWILKEEKITSDGVSRWYNLTITNPATEDLGKYLCVAENNGGVMEKTVILTFEDPATFSAGIPLTSEQLTIVIGVSVALVLLFVLVLIVCCCCFCKGQKKKALKNNRMGNGAERNGFVNGSDSQKLLPNGHGNLTNPQMRAGNPNHHLDNHHLLHHHHHHLHQQQQEQQHHPQHPHHLNSDYHGLPSTEMMHDVSSGYVPGEKYHHEGIEMQDLRAPSVISNTKQSTGSSSDGGRTTSISRSSFAGDGDVSQYPDLLDHHRYNTMMLPPHSVSPSTSGSGSTVPDHSRLAVMHQLNPANLMLTPQQQHQLASQLGASPFQRSGTLPLPHHHPHHPRSVSCDHTNANPLPHLYMPPVVHHHHHHPNQVQARPGYVTLPRRPRQSWSVPRETPSPHLVRFDREPIYDGIGPRTSVDGSSRLSLNKTPSTPNGNHHNGTVRTPLPSSTSFYAPIKEVQECPPTPKVQQARMAPNLPKSTPNILNLNSAESSGGAPLKQYRAPNGGSEMANSSSEATLMEENISGYCEPFGKALKPKNENRNSITSAESELDLVVPKASGESSEDLNASGTSSSSHHHQNGTNKNDSLNDKSRVMAPDSSNSGPKSSTPLRVNGVNGNNLHHHNNDASLIPNGDVMSPGFSDRSTKKSNGGAPKTLPKPKVKPVPPPKPKKSFQGDQDSSMAPLISFQDEGMDGSEV